MISHQHKCIYIHIPKCVGTSIEKKLRHCINLFTSDYNDIVYKFEKKIVDLVGCEI